MNSSTRFAALLTAALLATSSPSAALAERLPASVAEAVRAELVEGFGPHRAGEMPAPRRLARRWDVNGDGIDDWRIDYGRARFAYWCGTGGCLQQLWISHAGRHVLAFEQQALDLRLRRAGCGVLDVELHGVVCNRTGGEECPRSFRWDAGQERLQEMANRRNETLLSGPLFQPVQLTADLLPGAVRDAYRARVDACRKRGGRHLEYSFPVASVPDLDGDGRRDWIFDPTLTECEVADSEQADLAAGAPLRVFHSGDGQVREAPAPAGSGYDIDVATQPARLLPHPAEADAAGL